MTKPPGIADIVRTIIREGAAIKPGTATKMCKVAASPYFRRKLKARGQMQNHATRIDAGYCLDQRDTEE